MRARRLLKEGQPCFSVVAAKQLGERVLAVSLEEADPVVGGVTRLHGRVRQKAVVEMGLLFWRDARDVPHTCMHTDACVVVCVEP